MSINIVVFVLVVIFSEFLVALGFTYLTPSSISENSKKKCDVSSILKGVLERAFLSVTLCFNYPQALTAFGALKIGTRIKDTQMSDKSDNVDKVKAGNSYFLVGNLISILLAVIYVEVFKALF